MFQTFLVHSGHEIISSQPLRENVLCTGELMVVLAAPGELSSQTHLILCSKKPQGGSEHLDTLSCEEYKVNT